MTTKFSIICLRALLGLLLLTPMSSWSAPRILVAGLHLSAGDEARARSVVGSLQDALRQSPAFALLSLEAAAETLETQLPSLRERAFLMPGRALLQEARIYAEQAQFDKAIELLEQAEDALLFFREQLTSNQELIEIQLTLIQLHSALGHADQVDVRLERLIRLAPDGGLDPRRATPELLERYLRMRDDLLKAGGSIAVRADRSGARVYLNGADRGQAPVVLSSLPPGLHFIRLEDPVGRTFFQEVDLEGPGQTKVEAQLTRPGLYTSSRALPPSSEVVPRLARLYRTLGEVLSCDLLLVGDLSPEGLDVQLLSVQDGQRSPSYHIPMADANSAWPQMLRNLVGQLEGLVGADGHLKRTTDFPLATDPRTNPLLSRLLFADLPASVDDASTGMVSAEKSPSERTPLYKKTWFWATLGGAAVVAAGGTTAAVLLSDQGPSGGQVLFVLP